MGLNKLTLLDYPNKMAAAIFIGGCNFDCGFCHNSSLINPANKDIISKQEILDFLDKRKNILEGVCLTGAEPLLSNELESLILDIKSIKNYKIKLDTNGSLPNKLSYLLNKNLIDYIAMDIKNSKAKYPKIIGKNIDLNLIEQSIQLIISLAPDYEFRTTLIKEYHTKEDLISMLDLIKGAKRYALQTYIESEMVRQKGLKSFSIAQMQEFLSIAKKHITEAILR